MKTKTVFKPFKDGALNIIEPIYEHELATDSVEIYICNNSHCDDRTDRTYVSINTMYADSILINQVDGYVSVNGTKIQLNGRRNK